MSFTCEVKKELSEIETESVCCRKAFTYGFLLFGKSFSPRSISCASDYIEVINKFEESVVNITDVVPAVNTLKSGKHTLRISTASDRKKILDEFGHSANDISLRINYANFENECCYSSFLRGVFLSCGSLLNPEKGYHLEFVAPYYRLSQDLLKILTDLQFNAKYILRKYSHVIYLKDSESIEDLMTLMGAQSSTLRLMGIKIEKNVRNNINRQMNFESANMSRAIDAGLHQVMAIEIIEKKLGLDSLSDELKELAILRKENPDMTLKQLGESLAVPISRSGVNHRLHKLIDLAEKYK